MSLRHFRRAVVVVAFALAAATEPRPGLTDAADEEPGYLEGWSQSGEVSLLFIPVGGGSWKATYTPDPPVESDSVSGRFTVVAHGGLRAAGYGVLGRGWQLGGFASASAGTMNWGTEDSQAWDPDYRPAAFAASIGIAFKYGKMSKRGVFTAIGFEIGPAMFHGDLRNGEVRAQFAGASVTRLVLEYPMGDENAWALSFSIGLGGSIASGTSLDSTDAISTRWLRVEVPLMFGIAFGG
jgi:hypothetical protein